jgi:sigma-E factor negative regulatory protein RseA
MKDRISELMDGELQGAAAAASIDRLARERDGEALEAWRTYHLIGDAMRDTRVLSPGFAARVAARLAAEPTVLAPRRVKFGGQLGAHLGLGGEPRKWYALPAAAAAGVAAVGLVGWLALAPQPQAPQTPVAQAVPAPVAAKQPAIVPLPTSTPDYLLAHQGFSPRVSLQGMAPYARTVSAQANEGRQ